MFTSDVSLIVRFHALEGRADELLPLLKRGRDLGRQAAGCKAFDLYRQVSDPHQFIMVQRWVSQEQHDAYIGESIRPGGHLDRVFSLLRVPADSGPYALV